MKLRIFAPLLVVLLMLCACGINPASDESALPKTPEYTIKILRRGTRSDGKARTAVIDKLNEYLYTKLNVKVEIEFADRNSLSNRFDDIMVENEPLDLFLAGNAHEYLQKKDMFLPLDDLLDSYGQGIKKHLDARYLEYGSVDGQIYGINTLRDLASSRGFEYNAEIAQELNLDMNLTDVSQLTDVFAKVKAAGYSCTTQAFMLSWDPLMDGLGVLMNMGQSYEVVNLYETPEYKKISTLMHDWRKAGYFSEDTTTDYKSLLKEREIFGLSCISKPNFIGQEENMMGIKIGCVEFIPAFSYTEDIQRLMWMIPKTCRNPQKTMEVLNLLYDDPVAINLLCYGIEGVHYEYKDKQKDIIGYPPGVDASNVGYDKMDAFTWGNQLISHVWETDPPDTWEKMRKFNKNTIFSYAMGFSYDDSAVKSEVLSCNTVVEKYAEGLQNGQLDPKTKLPEFINELKAAGIDKIIAEKQRQLDSWFKKQGIKHD